MDKMNEMQEFLARMRPRPPRPELRRRVMTAAARAAGRSAWERMSESRAFWTAAAACLIAALVLTESLAGPLKPAASARRPSAEAVELAQALAAGLGDGDALAERYARQLSGPSAPLGGNDGVRTLLEETQWQG